MSTLRITLKLAPFSRAALPQRSTPPFGVVGHVVMARAVVDADTAGLSRRTLGRPAERMAVEVHVDPMRSDHESDFGGHAGRRSAQCEVLGDDVAAAQVRRRERPVLAASGPALLLRWPRAQRR